MYSSSLDGTMEGRIYLPPCYGADGKERHPVLYLLHGVTANDGQWDQLGVDEEMNSLLAEGEIPPFLIIMPREPSWELPPENTFGEALVYDLIPWVDEHYLTRVDRRYRSIGGLSRGGNWALHIGAKHWQFFGAVGGHSAPVFFGDGRKIPQWLSSVPEEKLPRLYLDIGEDDQNLDSLQDLEHTLSDLGIPHEWYLYPGTHDETYWGSHLEDYLTWYASPWNAAREDE